MTTNFHFPSALLASLLALGSVVGCTQTGAPDQAALAPGVTPAGFSMPSGAGCSGDIARYRAVMDNDVQIGHVHKSVYDKVRIEIDRAAAICAAGRDTEAMRMITATKSRYGYR